MARPFGMLGLLWMSGTAFALPMDPTGTSPALSTTGSPHDGSRRSAGPGGYGDFDVDQDVDLDDFAHFSACFSGANRLSTKPNCADADWDFDLDVDLDDFFIYQTSFTGPDPSSHGGSGIQQAPEPLSLVMAASALAGLGWKRLRRRRVRCCRSG